MNRSFVLPQAASAVLRQATQDLLFSPVPYHVGYNTEAQEVSSLAAALRGKDLTATWLRSWGADPAFGNMPAEAQSALKHRATRIVQTLPSGAYNAGITGLPLMDVLTGVIHHLARPVIIIRDVYDWRAARGTLIPKIQQDLERIEYPDIEGAMAKLSLARSYSRGEYYAHPEPRMKLTNVGYWSNRAAVGYRHPDAIRRIDA